MTNKDKALLIFAGGIVTGIIATYGYFKTKYEEKLEEDSKAWTRTLEERIEANRRFVTQFEDVASLHPSSIVMESLFNPNFAAKRRKQGMPYPIEEEEYGMMDDYLTMEFTLYSDGVVTDEDGDVVDDPDVFFGENWENFLIAGDSIYIRNDEREADYEICRDVRTYKEVNEASPHLHWRAYDQLE